MSDEIAAVKEKIAKLEEAMEKDHFGGLLDKSRVDKNYRTLKKLKKELKQLEEQQKKK